MSARQIPHTHVPQYSHSGYLDQILQTDRLRETSEKAALILAGLDFDAIAFSGMSGALIAPVLALALNKTLIMVRKFGDDSHSVEQRNGALVEGDFGAHRYVIVDDLISSGRTARYIRDQIAAEWKEFGFRAVPPVYIGLLAVNQLGSLESVKAHLRQCCGSETRIKQKFLDFSWDQEVKNASSD
jgi:hypothetical protein